MEHGRFLGSRIRNCSFRPPTDGSRRDIPATVTKSLSTKTTANTSAWSVRTGCRCCREKQRVSSSYNENRSSTASTEASIVGVIDHLTTLGGARKQPALLRPLQTVGCGRRNEACMNRLVDIPKRHCRPALRYRRHFRYGPSSVRLTCAG